MTQRATDPNTQATSDLLSFEEAGVYLRFGQLGYKQPGEAVRHLCRTRKLRHVKLGKRIFIRRKWLNDYVERESVAPVTELGA